MIRLVILLVLSSFIIIGYSQNLTNYLNYASEHHPSIKAKFLNYQSSLLQSTQVRTLADPQLSLGVFLSPVETRLGPQQFRLGITQMFPWFGVLKIKETQANATSQSKYYLFEQEKNEVQLKVKETWYSIYEIKKSIKLNEEYLEILNIYKRLALEKFKQGKSNMVDVIRIDIQIDDTKINIKLLDEQLTPNTIRFNTILNRDIHENVLVDDSIAIDTSKIAVDRDSLFISHPILIAYDYKLESLKSKEELAKKSMFPQIGVGLDYVFVGKRNDMQIENNGRDILMPKINVTLPIHRKKYNATIQEHQINQLEIEATKQAYINQLVTTYEFAQYQLNKSIELDQHYEKQISKIEQAVKLILSEYQNSNKNFEEVLRLQQKLIEFQLLKVKNTKEFWIAFSKIEYISANYE